MFAKTNKESFYMMEMNQTFAKLKEIFSMLENIVLLYREHLNTFTVKHLSLEK